MLKRVIMLKRVPKLRRAAVLVASAVIVTAPTAVLASQVSPSSQLETARFESRSFDLPEEWDRLIEDEFIVGDLVVPTGERWLIGSNVRLQGNLRTDGGTIGMRPGSSLRFIGADPERYVGGGHRFEARFSDDLGIWIGGSGVLDIQGTVKTGWNRSGRDPSWVAGDELWIAPTAPGDFEPRRWNPGEPIPQAHPRVPPAEVLNLTRDVLIEGPGHIHISSERPQRIEYVTLRKMGILNRSLSATSGRYALHLHMMGGGAAGTVVRGVAAIESGGRVFVPHGSHGITFEDNVAVNSLAEGFWWDRGDHSHGIHVDRLAVIGVHAPRTLTGGANRFDAISLNTGRNLVIRNSVAAGARGNRLSNGFGWISSQREPSVWEFDQGNVAHNNQGAGLRFWTNSTQPHLVANAIAYRNAAHGIQNGAYSNANRYEDVLLVENGIHHNSSGRLGSSGAGPGYTGLEIVMDGPAVEIGALNRPGNTELQFVNCSLQSGSHPKIVITREAKNPFLASFRHCDLTPEDVVFQGPISPGASRSRIRIEHELGALWEVTFDAELQQKNVRDVP